MVAECVVASKQGAKEGSVVPGEWGRVTGSLGKCGGEGRIVRGSGE